MLISVFTPTHRPDWLERAYRSLRDQTYPHWEWVLVPNGPFARIPPLLLEDARIRAVPSAARGIGALKRAACEACRGDVFVELDHDDELAPTALARIRDAVVDAGAGFVYSDFAEVQTDGTCRVPESYLAARWEERPTSIRGAAVAALHGFEPTPAALARIEFAPNHLRAWTRAAYDQAGGHDPLYDIADDYELVVRTYLARVPFHFLAECLYLQHFHAEPNTHMALTDRIHRLVPEIIDRSWLAITSEWARRAGLARVAVDWPDPPLGFTNVPLAAQAPDSVGTLLLGPGVIEAVGFGAPLVAAWNRAWEVVAENGVVVAAPCAAVTPFAPGGWREESFEYLTRAAQRTRVPGLQARFRHLVPPRREWCDSENVEILRAALVADKGGRIPGFST